MDYLAPLVSRMDVNDSPSSANKYSVPPSSTPSPSSRSNGHGSLSGFVSRIRGKSVDKPLPPAPSASRGTGGTSRDIPSHPAVRPLTSPQTRSDEMSRQTKSTAADLDLNNSEDTTVQTQYAPAVTRETIQEHVREIEHPRITREIHTHEYHHRVLPVMDVEVKPSRHWVEAPDGSRHEVSADQLPPNATKDLDRYLAEAIRATLPKDNRQPGVRQFTARDFPGTEGDLRETIDADGMKHSERAWIYPPTLANGGKDSGQTKPFYFDSANTAENGFREKV